MTCCCGVSLLCAGFSVGFAAYVYHKALAQRKTDPGSTARLYGYIALASADSASALLVLQFVNHAYMPLNFSLLKYGKGTPTTLRKVRVGCKNMNHETWFCLISQKMAHKYQGNLRRPRSTFFTIILFFVQ